jgi:hypothetical protein
MRQRGRDALGMSLWEALVFTAISAVLLNLCVVTFVQASRLATYSTDRAMRQSAYAQFSRDVTRAVHRASRVLPGVGETMTGENTVVLETPEGPVAIGMAGKSPAIWKLEEAGGTWALRSIASYPIASTIRFEWGGQDPATARKITIQVEGPPKKGPEDISNTREIVAAFRVDAGTL